MAEVYEFLIIYVVAYTIGFVQRPYFLEYWKVIKRQFMEEKIKW